MRSLVSIQEAKTAHAIVGRVSELLHARAFALDHQGMVVASSDKQLGGTFRVGNRQTQYLQVPLQIGNQWGTVVVGQPTNGEVISPRLARVLIELVISQTTMLERLPNRQSLKEQFIYDLLHGNSPDEEQVFRQAKLLNLNLMPPRAVILVDAADYLLKEEAGDRRHRRAQLIIGTIVNFFHLPDDTICADLKNGQVAVLKASNTQNLGEWAQDFSEPPSAWANLTALKRAADALLRRLRSDTATPISIGIGRYHPGIRGLARSYQDARAALALGHRFSGRNQVYCLDQLGIAVFVCLSDEQTKIELATHLLSPLDCEPELLETLTVFFEQDCCPSATAKRLSVHRNTLSYRLEKVASLTGLNPRCFDDAVQMRLALLLRCGAQTAEPLVLTEAVEESASPPIETNGQQS
ncbi:MAG: PucR family transcriptional regulator [Cyanophyceae cyanobacterium]